MSSIIPLLATKWEAIEKSRVDGKTTLTGKWFEDDSEYKIIVPEQLAEPMLEMQHYFYERYKNLKKHLESAHGLQHQLFGEEKS